ncbi:hypothetical protein [Marinisporobacter balticus]|uniref:hypothetical protein n=1 Tax=Marinisporobacter balticus TaxID=2018667 RepID=UPI0038CC011C
MEGDILENIDVNHTAVILWASITGVFNNIIKKESYLRHYHDVEASQLIEEAFKFMVRAIKT